MKTLEEFIKAIWGEHPHNIDKKIGAHMTAAEILRVAEERVDNDVEVGWDSAKELYNFLKSYINSTNMEGGE